MENTKIGTTTIAPEVINTISRLTTLATPGVSRMSRVRFPMTKKPHDPEAEGVKAIIKNNQLYIELYFVTLADVNVRMVSENVQQRVLRAVSEMTGMEVAHINVHITDIDFKE